MTRNRRGRWSHTRWVALAAIALAPQVGASSLPDEAMQRGLALLSRATLVEGLRSADTPPFHLHAHVRVLGLVAGTRDGEYTLVFAAPDRWSVRLDFPGYSEAVGVWEGRQWRKRNTLDRPFQFDEVLRLFDLGSHLALAPEATFREVWQRLEGAKTQLCVTVSPEREVWQRETYGTSKLTELAVRKDSSYDLCFDGDTGMLAQARYALPLPRFTFEGAVALGSKTFPKTLRCWEGNELAIEATVAELAPAGAAELPAVAPPAGAESWPACAEPALPTLIVKGEAPRTSSASARGQFATVVLLAEVGRDGLLHDLTPVQAHGSAPVAPLRSAVANWRYQPATCNGVPVPMRIYLSYSFLP
ncbi:MAG: hypothetical protein ACHQQS_05745 [Thermoanaerobaculales bacterium]